MNANLAAILLAFDLLGTFVFALQGSIAAVRAGLDPVGIAALAFVTACGGGIVRDLLTGAVPPAAVRDWRYLATALPAGALLFCLPAAAERLGGAWLSGFDAADLALFAAAGTIKALDHGLSPLLAILMGTITGVGGGTMRDVLLAQRHLVLYADTYATAAALGAAITVLGLRLHARPALVAGAGGLACFALRMLALAHGWHLPRTLVW